ncbi:MULTISPECIES: FliM/FliN family flagellar motor switch protein [Roseobacteraceae]|uniref:Surface presentation of antigens (SPOA) protein n=1 Tax=Celeribacter baekdonensis B30 TaxID=1208323 RepID=K2IFI7_9RHOB|nr:MULTISPECIES: FliM/FliN family flagellar motor switch protein [Roseobacteraceae]EKE68781.1 surface presentation of antigens (SPOA) protein [Celeribacter baekdonensis B30]KAB6718204.1 flagellar motor switch protein FliM [Roseobacter sp. TSBP12]|tara:strand:- start:27311 stop:28441 length:1131 start_codon:yes stop_codon:yes gene_type:complete
MSDADIISAMRRKAGVGRPPPDVQPMSPAKALRLAAAKAAEDSIGLVMQVTHVAEERSSILRLPEQLPDDALLSLLEGPDNAYGLAVFDRNVVSAVVEQQTTGKVLKLPPEERAPTATDAVMCTEITDHILSLFETNVAEVADPPHVEGFRVAAQLREARSISIAFEDVPYRVYRISVSLGRGVREGEILLVFPYARATPKPVPGAPNNFGRDFQAVVMTSEARLDTVLHRIRLPLADVMSLEVGMVLSIPRSAVSKVELRADDRLVSRAQLGQINGKRAVRLIFMTGDDDPLDASYGPDEGGFGDMGAPSGSSAVPALSNGMGDVPPMGDYPAMGDMGDLPPLGAFPALGDMGGDMGDLPDLGHFPAMGDLPSLE